jgi:hypothetical protein
MENLSALITECEQRWEEAHRVLIKASVAPSEPVPLLTGAEIEKLFRFYQSYHKVLQATGLAPRGVTVPLK